MTDGQNAAGASSVDLNELEARLDELAAVSTDFSGATNKDERKEARRLYRELSAIYISQIRDRQGAIGEALRAMTVVIRDETTRLRTNRVRQILDRISTLVGAATGEVPPDAETTPLSESVPSLLDAVSKFLEGVGAPVTGRTSRERPDVVVTPGGPSDRSTGSDVQKRLVAAIGKAAKEFSEDRFLMGAMGWIESRLGANVGTSQTIRGPFQFKTSTWKGLVKQLGAEVGLAANDIDDVTAQARMMAVVLRGYRERVAKIVDQPTPAMLYLVHLLGSPAAGAVLKASSDESVLAILRRFYKRFPSGSPKGAEFADKVVSRNPGILSDRERGPRTVAAMLSAVDELLLRGEGEYRALAGEVEPPEPADVPRWYAVALQEMVKGVSELPGNNRHHPDIVKYIRSTHYPLDLEEESDEDVPWCATFVNWSLEAGGEGTIRSARARDWLDWGKALEEPRIGCVVVLWRDSENSRKGHVGFFAGVDAEGRIQLLGGNQRTRGDGSTGCVCISSYPARRVLGYRWPTA